ncbi:MAG: protein-glutamate O-methyltransferase CheR [Caulobacteraceae bacterium]|nr:protein-glutamate O-methyltransferase CheR [Caulobacteraceae bacterium]
MSPDDLRRFCDFLYARTGMQFGENKRYYIERRLYDRLAETGEASFAAYFIRLRADPDEAAKAVNSFTVNETYFYREDKQLRCLSGDILPRIAEGKEPGGKIRIWSVPCATGEEPYSIALWLLENWRMVDAYNIEIVGSDIDTAALAAARAGRYAARSLSRLPEHVVHDYFEPAGRGAYHIIPDLTESVSFTEANLVDRTSMTAHGLFDVIFCRNVLIYFDDESRAKAAEGLFAALVPGGFVCLGHTESMTRISDRFEARRFADAIVYQRPEAS